MKITSKTPLTDIADALGADGYDPELAAAVKRAALKGCLVWTMHRLVTTDASRLSEHPRRQETRG